MSAPSTVVVVDGVAVQLGIVHINRKPEEIQQQQQQQRTRVDISSSAVVPGSSDVTTAGPGAASSAGGGAATVDASWGSSGGEGGGALFFCSLCGVQFLDSSAAMVHLSARKHRKRAGLKLNSPALVALQLDRRADADVTVDDLLALVDYKRIEKKVVPFSELRVVVAGAAGATASGKEGGIMVPAKRLREDAFSLSYV